VSSTRYNRDASEESPLRNGSGRSDLSSISGLGRADSLRSAGDSTSLAGSGTGDNVKLGFANLPDQMHRKAVKKGFNFSLMVVGESGLGKSTLINSLFMQVSQDLYKDREPSSAHERIAKTTCIEKRYMELDEKGVKLRLTVVDTPGFNDAVDSTQCWKPIEDYIDNTFEQYFKDECGLNRKNIQDHRVHCCLYFISPYGRGLRQIDVEVLRRLHNKVNIVPVIAKADTMTSAEMRDFKERVMNDLERHKIEIYTMPQCDSDDDEDVRHQEQGIRSAIPFCVIGSNCVVEEAAGGGKRVRGRQYPWGVVEVENPRHCDFTKLRVFLLGTHMQDLKDITKEVHYENYRAKYITERMSKRGNKESGGGGGGAATTSRLLDERRGRGVVGGGAKESAADFVDMVDPDSVIREKDEEIRRMQQMLAQMQNQMTGKAVGGADADAVGGDAAAVANGAQEGAREGSVAPDTSDS